MRYPYRLTPCFKAALIHQGPALYRGMQNDPYFPVIGLLTLLVEFRICIHRLTDRTLEEMFILLN